MNTRKILLAMAVILELLSVGLFLMRAQTAVAASVLVVGLTVLVIALNRDPQKNRER